MEKSYTAKEQAFTLIELIVVMAIIAILVLLAAPSFLNYTKDAKVTAMKQDTKILSDAAELYHVENEKWPKGEKIQSHNVGGVDELYTLDETGIQGSTKNIKGNYKDYAIVSSGEYEGQVFHLNGIKDKDEKRHHNYQEPIDLNERYKEYLASDEDFSGTKDGEFRYIGDAKIVLMPHEISGVPLTSYEKMFEDTKISKVISTNPNIKTMAKMFKGVESTKIDISDMNSENLEDTSKMFNDTTVDKIITKNFDMSNVGTTTYMFYHSKVKEVDVSHFDVSNVKYMGGMFEGAKNLKEIDVSHWDTSNVRRMWFLFAKTNPRKLDFSNWDTSKVATMEGMFSSVSIDNLDLSSFNTEKVISMKYMFRGTNTDKLDLSSFTIDSLEKTLIMFQNTKATTGYVKSQEIADLFNDKSKTQIPDHLTFTVK